MADESLEHRQQAERRHAVGHVPGQSKPLAGAFRVLDFAAEDDALEASALAKIRGAQLDLMIELGRTEMALEDVLKLRSGSIVPLEQLAGDPVDIVAGGRLIARGEVVVVEDTFCVRIVELVAAAEAA